MARPKKATAMTSPTTTPDLPEREKHGWRAAQRAQGFIGVPEACAELGMNKATLYNWMNKNLIDVRHVGANRRLVNIEQLRAKCGLPAKAGGAA